MESEEGKAQRRRGSTGRTKKVNKAREKTPKTATYKTDDPRLINTPKGNIIMCNDYKTWHIEMYNK